MDHPCVVGGKEEAAAVGKGEMEQEEEEERGVIVAIGAYGIVEKEGEEKYGNPEDRGERRLLEFFEARLAEDVTVGAHESVEAEPGRRDKSDAPPEVSILEDRADIGKLLVFYAYLPKQEERSPGNDGREEVAEYVFESLSFFVHNEKES